LASDAFCVGDAGDAAQLGRADADSGTNDSVDTELKAHLRGAGRAKGEAELEIEADDDGPKIEFEVEVESAEPGSVHDVSLSGVVVGQITIGPTGRGRLRLSNDDGDSEGLPLPDNFPSAALGAEVQVGSLMSGTLGHDDSDDDDGSDQQPSPPLHLAAVLTGSGKEHGEAELEREDDDDGLELELEVEVEDAVPGSVHDVAIDNVVVAQLTIDATGHGRLRLSSQLDEPGDLPIPDNFPANAGPASVVTVGSIVSGTLGLKGDLNDDDDIDADDVDMLFAAIRAGSSEARHDLDRNQSVNSADATYLVEGILGTVFGDANLDGIFNSTDLIQVFQAGRYEDSNPDPAAWQTGDWNGDGRCDSSDLVRAFQSGAYVPF
jgi:hypothetical protein